MNLREYMNNNFFVLNPYYFFEGEEEISIKWEDMVNYEFVRKETEDGEDKIYVRRK